MGLLETFQWLILKDSKFKDIFNVVFFIGYIMIKMFMSLKFSVVIVIVLYVKKDGQ